MRRRKAVRKILVRLPRVMRALVMVISRSQVFVLVGVAVLTLTAAAQVPRREPPPLALQSLTGQDSFDRYVRRATVPAAVAMGRWRRR